MALQRVTFFVDSADRISSESWLRSGVATGLTTNPTILRRAGARLSDIHEIYMWATGAGAKEVCFQTWGSGADEWYSNAMWLHDTAPNAVIKVPGTKIGLAVISKLQGQGIDVLMTAGYNAKQLLVGSAMGVKYFAPYFDRMNRSGRDGLREFRRMSQAVPQDGTDTLILAASIKSGKDVSDLVNAGVRTFTVAPAVLDDLLRDDLVDSAVEVFEDDMRAVM